MEIEEIVSTCSVNIPEGDFIVAKSFFLVAVGHHQAVAKADRQVTTCSLDRVPPPGGQKFVNRDAELKDPKQHGSSSSIGEINMPSLQALSPSATGYPRFW